MHNNGELKQRIENMDIEVPMTRGHFAALDKRNPYFQKCKGVLESLSKNDVLFSLFASEADLVLEKLEQIRAFYKKFDDDIASKLTSELEAEVTQTIKGIETICHQYQYHDENIQNTIVSVKNDIVNLEQTKKKLLEEVRSIPNESLVETFVRKHPKIKLNDEELQRLSGLSIFKKNLNTSDHKSLLQKLKQLDEVESKLGSLEKGLKMLQGSLPLSDKHEENLGDTSTSHFNP